MRTRILGVMSLWPVAIIATSVHFAAIAKGQSEDEIQIRQLQARLNTAVAARDLNAVMKEYVPGNELFVFDSDIPRQHTGWNAYKDDWWKFLGSAVDVKADVEGLGITVEGKAAFSHHLLHLTWGNKSDGSRSEQLMSVSDAYRKIDGKWLIVMEHWSLPVKDGKAVLMAVP